MVNHPAHLTHNMRNTSDDKIALVYPIQKMDPSFVDRIALCLWVCLVCTLICMKVIIIKCIKDMWCGCGPHHGGVVEDLNLHNQDIHSLVIFSMRINFTT